MAVERIIRASIIGASCLIGFVVCIQILIQGWRDIRGSRNSDLDRNDLSK